MSMTVKEKENYFFKLFQAKFYIEQSLVRSVLEVLVVTQRPYFLGKGRIDASPTHTSSSPLVPPWNGSRTLDKPSPNHSDK